MNTEQNQVKVVTDESLEAAVKKFRQNSYWRSIYDNAPEKAKRLYALQFWPSANVELYDRCKEEVCPLVQAAQAALGVADLEYLIEHTSSKGMAALTRAHYRKLLAAAKEREVATVVSQS